MAFKNTNLWQSEGGEKGDLLLKGVDLKEVRLNI